MACSCLPVSPFTHGHATKRPLSDSSNFIGPFGIEHTPRCHELSTDAHIYRISMWKLTGDEEQNTQPIDGVHFGRRCERVSERMQTGEAVWIWTSFMSQMTSTVRWFTHFSNETLTTKEVTKIIWKKIVCCCLFLNVLIPIDSSFCALHFWFWGQFDWVMCLFGN